jgi:hypothetical protein
MELDPSAFLLHGVMLGIIRTEYWRDVAEHKRASLIVWVDFNVFYSSSSYPMTSRSGHGKNPVLFHPSCLSSA